MATPAQYAAEAAQAAQDAAYEAEGVFPPFDASTFPSQLFWLAVTFFTLYFLLSRWLLPRIGSAIEERRDRVADDLDAAAQMKAQADETAQAYEKSLADARARASALAAEAKAEMDRLIEEETADAARQAEARQAEAEARIAEAKAKAMENVRTIAAEAASAAAERLAGLEIAEDDARKAVDAANAR